jgi:hypothetical protein
MLTEAMAAAWATPGLGWLIGAALLAGLVRGFAGFGTAMVFVPVAARVTDPVTAVTLLVAMDLLGPLVGVSRALRDAHLPDLARIGLGILVGVPVGVAILVTAAPESFRLALSLLTLAMLVLLAGGLRYRGPVNGPLLVGIGGVSGVIGGATTLFGPVTILFYMASTLPPQAIRANLTLYLIMTDVVFLALLAMNGVLAAGPLLAGLALAVPYALANLAGAAIFRPEAAQSYRAVAYAIIAGSALSGLPIFG